MTEWLIDLGSSGPAVIMVPIFMRYNFLPASLRVDVSVKYTNSAGELSTDNFVRPTLKCIAWLLSILQELRGFCSHNLCCHSS